MFFLFRKQKSQEAACLDDLERRRQAAGPEGEAVPFSMTVADVFTIRGRGTVVTGTVEQGSVRVGDRLTVTGSGGSRSAAVTGIESFRKRLSAARQGDHVGLLLSRLSQGQVKPGDVCAGGEQP